MEANLDSNTHKSTGILYCTIEMSRDLYISVSRYFICCIVISVQNWLDNARCRPTCTSAYYTKIIFLLVAQLELVISIVIDKYDATA